eukprot:scaffold2568_cov107-Skeletonema_dohrnii-CCMP3373.AAC.3
MTYERYRSPITIRSRSPRRTDEEVAQPDPDPTACRHSHNTPWHWHENDQQVEMKGPRSMAAADLTCMRLTRMVMNIT